MSEPKNYYDRLILTREFIVRSEMLPVDPFDINRTLDEPVDQSEACWNEYYAIYSVDEFGDRELVEDGTDYEKISKSFASRLYDLYVEDFDPMWGEPVCFDEWKNNDLVVILNEVFSHNGDNS